MEFYFLEPGYIKLAGNIDNASGVALTPEIKPGPHMSRSTLPMGLDVTAILLPHPKSGILILQLDTLEQWE